MDSFQFNRKQKISLVLFEQKINKIIYSKKKMNTENYIEYVVYTESTYKRNK